jgi:uncharacterized coiled-coil DUF342 family protein
MTVVDGMVSIPAEEHRQMKEDIIRLNKAVDGLKQSNRDLMDKVTELIKKIDEQSKKIIQLQSQ